MRVGSRACALGSFLTRNPRGGYLPCSGDGHGRHRSDRGSDRACVLTSYGPTFGWSTNGLSPGCSHRRPLFSLWSFLKENSKRQGRRGASFTTSTQHPGILPLGLRLTHHTQLRLLPHTHRASSPRHHGYTAEISSEQKSHTVEPRARAAVNGQRKQHRAGRTGAETKRRRGAAE